jgi:predicted RNA-binding Zn-ribbon protein involved in translation (DUF1610 family)
MDPLGLQEKQRFPCPLCGEGLTPRQSKKGKPYVVCNGCGVQMFVRTEEGIQRFNKLMAEATTRDIWQRLAQLEQRYQKKCPECGKKFWIAEDLIETSWFDGTLIGYRCPDTECDGRVKPEDAK